MSADAALVPAAPEVAQRRPDWDLDDATLRATGSIKWTHAGPEVLPAWVAEMDVAPAPVVVGAMTDAIQRGAFGYPAEDRVNGLPEATAAFLGRRYGWAVDPADVMSCGDVMAGIRLVIEQLCAPAPIVVPVPSYPPFLDIVPLTGRLLVPVPCRGRALDLDAVDAALAAGARTVLLSQPHNPLGRVFTAEELGGLRDVVDRHGARVISDEIHAPLVLPGARHQPYALVPGTAEHVVTVTAASKAWNTPGLKCAQIITSTAADRAALHAAPHVANHGVSPLGITASIAAYTLGEPWLEHVLAHLDRQRARFGTLLQGHLPEVTWTPMEATYLAWVDAAATGLEDPARTARTRGAVFVNPGRTFGPGYERFVRVNLATSAERLERVVLALARAWRSGG